MDMIDRVKQAITNIKKGRNRLTITSIADRAGVSRKTIYNRPDLKLLCDQAIQIQKQEQMSKEKKDNDQKQISRPLSGYKLLEQRYNRLRDVYKEEQEKNMQLLNENNELVLEKEQLKSKIMMLEERIERLNKDKVRSIK